MMATAVLFPILVRVVAVAAETAEAQLNKANGSIALLNSETAPAWADSSTYRGTSDLLWSCIVTIFACIYTSIHMNIPIEPRSQRQRLFAKLRWAAMALFAPELVLYAAFSQFQEARKLSKKLESLTSRPNEPRNNEDVEKASNVSKDHGGAISMAYCFWIVMGGFVLDISDIFDGSFPHAINRNVKRSRFVTLTPKGIEILAKEGHLPPLPEQRIDDRSKANLLAKSLVCLQVTWMLVQCIARKAAHYPLSLLEIHTMVHVCCALGIYSLWLKKPLDVTEPICVDQSDFKDITALMLMAAPPYNIRCANTSFAELDYLAFYPESNERSQAAVATVCDNGDTEVAQSSSALAEHPHQPDANPAGVHSDTIQDSMRIVQHYHVDDGKAVHQYTKSNKVLTLKSGQSLVNGFGPLDHNFEDEALVFDLGPKDIRRWTLAAAALKRLPNLPNQSIPWIKKVNDTYCPELKNTNLEDIHKSLCIGRWNFNIDGEGSEGRLLHIFGELLDSPQQEPIMYGIVCVLSLVYGGIHLSAWDFNFASDAESLLWKITCIGIMSWNVVYLGLAGPTYMAQFASEPFRTIAAFMSFLSLFALLLFAPFCRMYIVVESFISLRRVPLGVYAAVPWVQSIPHL